ncbi:hypothetical protein BC830DRAFT_1172266 [Chytriomyces sp. MP71]|nr:hypothetical protein BC830DRAFT_1172266 [Chytriomyces sp. MP71]
MSAAATPKLPISVQSIAPIRVASLRATLASFREQGGMWAELLSFLSKNGTAPSGPTFTLVHSCDPQIVVEVCAPIDEATQLPVNDRITAHVLPAIRAAVAVHHGPMQDISNAHERVSEWVVANKKTVVGPAREVYLKVPIQGDEITAVGWDNVTVESGTHVAGVLAMSQNAHALSFAHIIKSAELACTAILSALILRTFYSWQIYTSLITVCAGIALASVAEVSLSMADPIRHVVSDYKR